MNERSTTTSETATLKEEKEDFVTGHNGTTSEEVFLILLSAPLGMILYITIWKLMISSSSKKELISSSKNCKLTKVLQIILEYLIVILPMCICETNMLYPTIYLMIGLCMLSIPYLVLTSTTNNKNAVEEEDTTSTKDDRITINKPEYVSWYRSLIILYTIIAILAVDFHIFPRRFAKVEIYGYSLMDLGAGSCIISSALVSPYAKTGQVFVQRHETKTNTKAEWWMLLLRNNYSIWILFVIGMIRTIILYFIEYQEHASEYGIHWNFFLTLSVLSLSCNPLRMFVHTYLSSSSSLSRTTLQMLLPILLSITYQISLSWTLHDFIVHAPRTCNGSSNTTNFFYLALCNFFYANREGIIGCVGYLILYYFAEEIAFFCIWSSNTNNNGNQKQQHHTSRKCMTICLVLWSIHLILSTSTNIPISRRSTNLPFIIWTLAMNMNLLTILYFIHRIVKQLKLDNLSFNILSSMNSNNFLVFMIANLCTGLINLSIDTLRVSDNLALVIICSYVTLLVGIVLWIQWSRITGI